MEGAAPLDPSSGGTPTATHCPVTPLLRIVAVAVVLDATTSASDSVEGWNLTLDPRSAGTALNVNENDNTLRLASC